MSEIANARSYTMPTFRGEQTALEDSDISPQFAFSALNAEFLPGQVRTRAEFTPVVTRPTPILDLIYHQLSGEHYLFYCSNNKCFARNINAGSIGDAGAFDTELKPGGTIIYTAEIQGRVYICSTDNYGAAVGSPVVFSLANGITNAFRRPLYDTEISFSFTEPSSGNVTSGQHQFLVVFGTKNGYFGKASPVSSGTSPFLCIPQSFVSTGGKNLTVTVTPGSGSLPVDLTSAYLLMNTVANPQAWYKVPDSLKTFMPGAGSVSWTVNLEDDLLRATGAEALADLYWATADGSGTLPFVPRWCAKYGDRVVWGAANGILISEPGEPERLTLDKHFRSFTRLPVNGFQIGNSFFLQFPDGLESIYDTGGYPVDWPKPEPVEGQISSPSMRGVSLDSSLRRSFIASPGGLYEFSGGAIPRMPLSFYNQPKWDRFDWSIPGRIRVLQDSVNRRVFVVGPRKPSAGGGAQMLLFDYSLGLAPDKVNCGEWTFSGGAFAPSCLALARRAPNVWELWISGSSNGDALLRQKSIQSGDTLTYGEFSSGIDFRYHTCPLPPLMGPQLWTFLAVWLRAKGSGTLRVEAVSVDGLRTVEVWNPALSSTPGRGWMLPMNAQGEWISLRFSFPIATTGNQAVLSFLQLFYSAVADYR